MNDIKTLTIKFSVPQGKTLNQSVGSIMQGVMMEHISSAYATKLHEQGLNPYSQYSHFDRKTSTLTWTINALNSEACTKIIDELKQNLPTVIHLHKKQFNLAVKAKQITNETNYSTLAETYLTNECLVYKYSEFNFDTSTSFKNKGEYMIFPNQFLVLNSLLNRWNNFAQSEAIEEENLALNLAMQTYVSSYEMKLVPFYLERTKILAFKGKYILGLKTDTSLKNIIYLLTAYAKFAGVGIKTSVGMGATITKLLK